MTHASIVRTCVALLAISMAAACTRTAKEEEPVAPPVTTDKFQEFRTDLQKDNPDVETGLVVAVLPARKMAGVGEVDFKKFKPGDAITFVDSTGKPLANGTVEVIAETALYVKVSDVLADGRFPKVGDAAIKVE